ncbi:MAG: hypothetical protein AAGB48_05805 [Planctomycetota bacterium]
MPEPVTIAAHAKVNLALSVGPPASAGEPGAGLHPIASWMAPIQLADLLTLEPDETHEVTLRVTWADDAPRTPRSQWHADDDLAVRALRRLAAATGRPLGGTISLTKRIPAAGGLGGGSSDAAACLIAADRAFGLNLPHAQLEQVGRSLGSDIGFFLDPARRDDPAGRRAPGAAMVTGFGETVRRMPIEPGPLLLIVPPFGCSTPEVYRAFDEGPVTLDEPAVIALAESGTPDPAALFNDLLRPALRIEPRLAELRRGCERVLRCPVHLSGSGSTLFVVGQIPVSAVESLGLREPKTSLVPTSLVDPHAESQGVRP